MKRRHSATLATFILAAFFTCLIAMPVMAGNQPPPGDHPMGPAIMANITFVANPGGGIDVYGDGTCQNKPIEFYPTYFSQSLDDITPESLLDNYISPSNGLPHDLNGQVAECVPSDTTGMIVRAVIDFQEDESGNYKYAKVILLFLVPK